MKITIKKVFNCVLLGTIISASVTAPAQAGSLKNLNNNDDLIKTQNHLVLDDSKDILLDTQTCKETDFCMSSPEFDLEEVLDNQDAKNPIDNSFLKQARDTIETIQGASLYRVITTENGVEHLVPETEFIPSENPDLYTSIYFTGTSERKKVPESSALIGLITFFLLAAKRQKSKNSQTSVE